MSDFNFIWRSATVLLAVASFLLASCSQSTIPTSPTNSSPLTTTETPFQPATNTAVATFTPTAPPPTAKNTDGPVAPLPADFTSDILRPDIEPLAYLADSCAYFAQRWDPAAALPGTVVAPIMFHSILEGNTTPTLSQDINYETFLEIIDLAQDLGYETITSEELLGFLLNNEKIPPRSMILILDDRRPGTAEDYFLPVLEQNDWTLTLAWIAGSDNETRDGRLPGESLWDWIERLNETGYFDAQSHGLNHIYLNSSMDESTVREEIAESVPLLKQHFANSPLAYIWPGGNYTPLGVQVAHEAGFELGFTIHARGPLLFNWIPQGEKELAYNDPLMLLPRFWDTAALLNLEQTAQLGDAAQAFARENYAVEATWFSQNCGGELPELDQVFKD